jgi:NhaC family Na+:H+ antiporter
MLAGTGRGPFSPLSETATLAPAVAGTDVYTHIRYTVLTTFTAFLLSLGLYLGLGYQTASALG